MSDFIKTLELLEAKTTGAVFYRGWNIYFDSGAPVASRWKADRADNSGIRMNTNSEEGIKRMIDNKMFKEKG
jgi:hypothetical protein